MSSRQNQNRGKNGAKKSARPQNMRNKTSINWEEITLTEKNVAGETREKTVSGEAFQDLFEAAFPDLDATVEVTTKAETDAAPETGVTAETETQAEAGTGILPEEEAETESPDSGEEGIFDLDVEDDEGDVIRIEKIPLPKAAQEKQEKAASSQESSSRSDAPQQARNAHARASSVNGTGDRSPRAKAARPTKIAYVDVTPHENFVVPLNKKTNSHRGIKVFGFILGMVVVAAATAYAGVSYYYTDRFIPGTTINGIDCSGKTAFEVEQIIAAQYQDYSISVASRGNAAEEISGSSIDYHYLSSGEVLKLLQQQKPYTWALGYLQGTSYSTQTNITFDRSLLRSQLKALACTQDENQESPENAYVTLSGDSFTIVPETAGNEIKVKEAYRMLDDAVASGAQSVDFDSDPEVYRQAELTQNSPLILSMLDAYNSYAAASITYDFGEEEITLDSDTLKTWLEFDEDGMLITAEGSFEQHVRDFVAQLAADYNTVGTSRAFYSTSGRLVYVYGSSYGWLIDQEAEVAELMDEITSGTQITREPVYSMRANSHGFNDLGDTYIEVDMGDQHMYYYRDGYDIFESDFVSGDITEPDRATPEGIYTLYSKQSPAVLRGRIMEDGEPEYETPVTYWMPFNGGVGFHDAEWQPWFGGDRFIGGGSHGCINLPYYAAAELYSIIDYGDPIVCFY